MAADPNARSLGGPLAILLVGVVWIAGLALRLHTFETHSLDQAVIHPHFYAALMGRGEPWPFVGPPAAFFLRHGTVNALLLTLAQPFVDHLADSARFAVVIRSLGIPLVFLVGRAVGAPSLGLIAAVCRAFAPETVHLDRHFGGTYFLDTALLLAMWGVAAGRAASTARLAATGFVTACLPLIHPMGLPSGCGIALAGVLLLRERTPRERAVILGVAFLPLLPYAVAEVVSGFGATRSVLLMLTGGLVFEAPGADDVGLGWTVRHLLQAPAPAGVALLATLGFLAGLPLAVGWFAVPRIRAALGVPGLAYATSSAALLGLLLAVQGGAGYGHGHHVFSAFLLGIATLACLWGHWQAAAPAQRPRREGILAIALAVLVAPSLPGRIEVAVGATEYWTPALASYGSAAAMADLVAAERGGGPMHLLLVHGPDARGSAVALSAVVVDLLEAGLPLDDLPQQPPGVPVEGWLIMVGTPPPTAPGRSVPFVDPDPHAEQLPVTVRVAPEFMDVRDWAAGLPDDWEVFGTEEYQDLIEYYFARPRWPGNDGMLPVMDTPYRSAAL